MLENIRCNLCNHYYKAKVIRKEEGRDSNKKKSPSITRTCLASGNKVTLDSAACDYFNPKESFWCDVHNCSLHLLNCINRRRNSKGFKAWERCLTDCRQYQRGISDVISDYYVNQTPIKSPSKIRRRKRKRSKDDDEAKEPKRKIRRRSNPKRKIRRREVSQIKEKVKRVIKRRKPKPPKRVIKRRNK